MGILKLKILFLSFSITDAIDIFLVAVILYLLYNMVKGTSAVNIFIGLAVIYFLWIIIRALDLKLLSSLMGKHALPAIALPWKPAK